MCNGDIKKDYNELVSVVIATYNGEKYIKEQLLSILQQSYKNIEIIITDDNSKDNTVDIVKQILNKNTLHFSILEHKKNVGVVRNFIDGICESHGSIIFLCDQDDYWEQDKITLFMNIFNDNDSVGLVSSNAYIADKDLSIGNTTLWDTLDIKEPITDKDTIKREMLRRNIFTGMSMAFRASIIDDGDWFSCSMLHDEMIAWIAIKKTNIVMLNVPTSKYRQHETNVVGASSRKKIESISKTVRLIDSSNQRYYRKFLDIKSFLESDDCFLNQAIDFYCWKSNILSSNILNALIKWIKYLFKGYYRKYTSRTDYAIIKDLVLIMFGRNKKG